MKALLRITGLTADTVRAWERRYGAVKPKRSANGRRIYTEDEANRLRLLADLVREGFAIGEIARLSDRELVTKLSAYRDVKQGRAMAATKVPGAVSGPVSRLLDAVHRFDLKRLKVELARVRFVTSPREFALYLVPQLMVQVGIKVAAGELDVAQEHALSDMVRSYLRQTYSELDPVDAPPGLTERLLFATPEGQLHEFGLMIAAISCRFRGLPTELLGPNLPAKSAAQAARELRATAVVLSFSSLPPQEEKIKSQDYLEDLDRQLPRHVALWVGGSGSELLRRRKIRRDLWIFESIEAFEQKLDAYLPKTGRPD